MRHAHRYLHHARRRSSQAQQRLRHAEGTFSVMRRAAQLEGLAESISGRMQKALAALGTGVERAHRADAEAQQALSEIGAVFGADTCFLHLFSSDGKLIATSYEWRADGLASTAEQLASQAAVMLPYMLDEHRVRTMAGSRDAASVFVFPDPADAPEEVRATLRQNAIQAVAFIPLYCGADLIGYCGLDSRHLDPDWSVDDLKQFKLMGEVMTNALLTIRAEAMLADEGNLLQALIDAIPHVLYAKDVNGRLIACNSAAAAMDGRAPQEMIGATDWETFSPDTTQHYHDDELSVITRGISQIDHEETVIDQHGVVHWFSATRTPLRDESGTIRGIAGLGRDITEEKDSLQALRQNESRFRALFEASSAGIVILRAMTSPDGEIIDYQYVDVNQRYETIVMLPRAEAIGKRITEVFCGASHDFIQAFRKVQETGAPYRGELYFRKLDKHLYVSVCQMDVGYIAAIVIDITDAKKAEEELRNAEAGLRHIFQNASMGVFRVTPDGRFLFINTVMARLYGYESPQEMLDASGSQTDFATRLFVDAQRRADFVGALNTEGAVTNFESQQRRKDGSVIWTRAYARTVWSAPDTPKYYDGFIEDITDRKKAERIIEERESQFRILAENMRDVIWTLDNEHRYTYISPSIRWLRGKNAAEVMREGLMEAFTPESREIIRETTARRNAAESSGIMDAVYYLELKMYDVDGGLHCVELLTQALLTEVTTSVDAVDAHRQRIGFLGNMRDITARKETEEKLQYAGAHDALTGLYNRARLQYELDRLCREGPFPFSIILGDVDGLKRANDQFGHAAGDELLRRAAQVFTKGCRSNATIARYGGDEFAVLLPETGAIAARAAALLLQAELVTHNARISENPHTTDAPLSIAIGVATATRSMNPDELMNIVDARMYADKRTHGDHSAR